ncbi:olfactory receptor 5B21-like [Rhinatrema bivittatum]|uniref:olfactory receptor 5B21-like n=1 Tax=Rhinatrema bivittatum TaxID=194408 RepID=UPI00112E6A80|nr:olfactory receptor 5B21-like [Rhinatrema bivittatum]
MSPRNDSAVTDFLILGFSDLPGLRVPLFLLFLLVYLFTLAGNLLILAAICTDSHLHTPMYFFLCNLSVLDICYLSVTIPKLLTISLTGSKNISFSGCMAQLYFFMSFASVEYFVLAAMAYDRYAAICNPLRYSLVMGKRICVMMATAAWLVGFLDSVVILFFISRLDFCDSNEIDHFFCDVAPLLLLSCSDTRSIQLVIFIEGAMVIIGSFLLTLASYVHIISAIFRIHSAEGRRKAFSTCTSHITTVTVFYSSIICAYMRPSGAYSLELSKLLAMLYTAMIPMLNPIIYSMRNKDVKGAFRKIRAQSIANCRTSPKH